MDWPHANSWHTFAFPVNIPTIRVGHLWFPCKQEKACAFALVLDCLLRIGIRIFHLTNKNNKDCSLYQCLSCWVSGSCPTLWFVAWSKSIGGLPPLHSHWNPPVSTGHAKGVTLRGILKVDCAGGQHDVAVTSVFLTGACRKSWIWWYKFCRTSHLSPLKWLSRNCRLTSFCQKRGTLSDTYQP